MKDNENGEQRIIDKIGNLDSGRPNLGLLMPVFMFRFFFLSTQEKLKEKFGQLETDKILYDAGFSAGNEFCENFVSYENDVKNFLVSLQTAFKEQRIAILQLENMDLNSLYFEVSMSEDVDCSGAQHEGRYVCSMCEGFLSGIFSFYFKRIFDSKELDSWTSDIPKCTFEIKPKKTKKPS